VVDKTFQTSADFVVGADGSNSHVRQCLGIEYDVVGDRELFVVYEFETDGKCGHEMRIVLGDNTTSVMWPLSDNKCRWSFQIMPTDSPGDFPGKDRSVFTIEEAASEDDSRHHLQRLIEERAPWFEGTVKELNWSTDIQFEHRLARQFGRNRCWLAGDAAHQTGPVGMQSLNVGLREAADLAGRAKKILREKASEDLLQTYNSDRQAEWQCLLGLKGGPKPAESSDPWIKQHCARIPACLPASGEDLTVLLKRLGLDFK
jgi:2-polyprenyl-6-methoxyphenol hydroxylase-like FAD-dependent oxidoreductase